MPLVHPGLAEGPLVTKTKAQRRLPGGPIQGIALPLVAAIAQGEGIGHHQRHGRRRQPRLLQGRREVQPAHLHATRGGVDAQVAGEPQRPAAPRIDNGIELGIDPGGDSSQPGQHGRLILEGAAGEIGPHGPAVGTESLPQAAAVALGIERFQATAPAPQHPVRGELGATPVGQRLAQGLAMAVEDGVSRHRRSPLPAARQPRCRWRRRSRPGATSAGRRSAP